jgi:two-component system sensor histidine kinase MprB
VLRDVYVDEIHYRMLTRHLAPGVAIQVARDMTGTDDILAGLQLRLVLLGLGGVVAAGGMGWAVSRRSLRPVGQLTTAASHVAETRDLDARIDVSRSDEIGQLAASFNAMLAALEEARQGQQRLIADASHELRTPLTSLRTNIELLQRGAVEGLDREELLDDVGQELAELTHLVGEVVDLATIGGNEEPRLELDLAEIVDQAAARLRRRSDVEVNVSAEPTIIEGRREGLLRAVSNLLENAAKWGEGRPIDVVLHDGEVSVRDRGPGIPPDDLDHVFERFYRSPAARSMPGSGLGLSIVAAVAQDHGGSVCAANASDGGAIVTFSVAPSRE